mgnify:CR=1 FL=1|tara:strand:- start:109 stop:309 length:201 start_codon:yes stop_codon:yes gene_type:complete
MVTSDESKALRLRKSALEAELERINELLGSIPAVSQLSARDKFYRDAENDFKNTDSNGNYLTQEDC